MSSSSAPASSPVRSAARRPSMSTSAPRCTSAPASQRSSSPRASVGRSSATWEAAAHRPALAQYSGEILSQLLVISASTAPSPMPYTIESANVPDDGSMALTIPFVAFALFRYLLLLNGDRRTDAPGPHPFHRSASFSRASDLRGLPSACSSPTDGGLTQGRRTRARRCGRLQCARYVPAGPRPRVRGARSTPVRNSLHSRP